MNKEIKISLEELKSKNIIYINNIQEGFNKYPNCIIEGTEDYVNNFIRKLVKINGLENSYGDFYYGRLKETEKDKIKAVLDENEVNFIESIKLGKDDTFVRLNYELLEILLKLTAKEILFSSFYFTKYPSLIWGNYETKYPMFFKDEDIKNIIMNEILYA
ncbi:hypothetical protein NNC19_22380 [Clostridium sp. SHJSY1]|uniref:hypothetical protein n=1 Tax=Clostridium sp. SHJSY1 TaxID=2942483 RepID=UPI002873F656|nr:hypothetical protein [Clostridium sp. SHJSY1]MDS0528440.1 hypothetical protein [Clostridium sp. SHJSY1]